MGKISFRNFGLFIIFYIIFLGCCDLQFYALAGSSENDSSVVRYDGAQVWEIQASKANSKKAVEVLQQKFDCSTWKSNAEAETVLIRESNLEGAKNLLKTLNLDYKVKINNVQKHIDSQTKLRGNRGAKGMIWTDYNRHEDIQSYLSGLPTKYKGLVTREVIGKTAENRDLTVVRISNGNPTNQAIWIDGGIHAREWISPAVVLGIINTLTSTWDSQPDYVKNIDWYILPLLNPDGYEYTHTTDRMWRKNRNKRPGQRCVGVDLNRNYGFMWGGKGTSSYACSEVYKGPTAFSENESKAMLKYLPQIKPKPMAYMSFHSYGQYLLYPYGDGDKPAENAAELQTVGELAAESINEATSYIYTAARSTILGPGAGGSDDWAKGDLGMRYVFTVEMRDTGNYGFLLPPSHIKDACDEGYIVITTVAKKIANS